MSASDPTAGHIELEWSLDAIRMGYRHRQEQGDIAELAESIRRQGFLHPLTITPDGLLICGGRRYLAAQYLGLKTVNVWVRTGISDKLSLLLAEQDENQLRLDYTDLEKASLYRELRAELAADAARRQEATRFTSEGRNPRSDGAAESTAPHGEAGDVREQAARMVTGKKGYTKLEQIGRLEELAADDAQPTSVRERAQAGLDAIGQGGSVSPAYRRAQAEQSLAELGRLAEDDTEPGGVRDAAARALARLRGQQSTVRAAELERVAADTLARVRAATKRRPGRPQPVPGQGQDEPARYPIRVFVATVNDLTGFTSHFDPAELAAALDEEQWAEFETVLDALNELAEQMRSARTHRLIAL